MTFLMNIFKTPFWQESRTEKSPKSFSFLKDYLAEIYNISTKMAYCITQ